MKCKNLVCKVKYVTKQSRRYEVSYLENNDDYNTLMEDVELGFIEILSYEESCFCQNKK